MNDATRTELQAILGPDWRVVGGTTPPMQPPGWSMFLFDFQRTLYIGIATGQPHRWVLWDGQGDWFGGGDDVIDVAAMAADLRAFVGVTNERR
jgi:hypothetical protein